MFNPNKEHYDHKNPKAVEYIRHWRKEAKKENIKYLYFKFYEHNITVAYVVSVRDEPDKREKQHIIKAAATVCAKKEKHNKGLARAITSERVISQWNHPLFFMFSLTRSRLSHVEDILENVVSIELEKLALIGNYSVPQTLRKEFTF